MLLDHALIQSYVVDLHRRAGIDREGLPPISTTRLGEAFRGLSITGSDALPGGALAVLVRVGHGWIISYDRSLADADRRFAIAHEFGHLAQLEGADLGVSRLPCGPAGSPGERWCDAFAAELLVPLPSLHLAVGGAPMFPEDPAGKVAWEDFVDQLHGGRMFGVPRDVMLQRLRELATQRGMQTVGAGKGTTKRPRARTVGRTMSCKKRVKADG